MIVPAQSTYSLPVRPSPATGIRGNNDEIMTILRWHSVLRRRRRHDEASTRVHSVRLADADRAIDKDSLIRCDARKADDFRALKSWRQPAWLAYETKNEKQ